jgi:hypothetical protein
MTTVWENPTKPIPGPFGPTCPLCGANILGPFPAYDESNRVVQKTCCTKCSYIARAVSGFQSMKDADTAVFK